MEIQQPRRQRRNIHPDQWEGHRQAARAETARGKVLGGPREVVDCGMGQARLQLADPTRWWLADPGAPHLCIDKLGGSEREQRRPRN